MRRSLWCAAASGLLSVVVVLVGGVRAQESSGQLPPEGTARYMVGGDARDDWSKVVPWAFHEAKARGARGFIFLGDMELDPMLDSFFKAELQELAPIPFYPALGNHEILHFGIFSLGFVDKLLNPEKRFRDRFLGTAETPVRSFMDDRVVYGTDLDAGVHFLAPHNLTQKGSPHPHLPCPP